MSSNTRTRKTNTTGSTRTLRTVPDQTTVAAVRTATEDQLWAALYAHPNSTAADLSTAAKIGKSTAQKILAKWAADGGVTRTAGIAEGGRRAADLWAIPDTDATADANGTPTDVESVHSAPNSADTMPEQPATRADPETAEADDASRGEEHPTEPASSDTLHRADDALDTTDIAATEPVDTESAAAQPAEAVDVPTRVDGTSSGSTAAGDDAESDGDHKAKAHRLASGALRGMVEDFLRDHPDEEFGPHAIAKALGGKSSGAVSNALDKLATDATVIKTKNQPRRFALATAERKDAPAPTN